MKKAINLKVNTEMCKEEMGQKEEGKEETT